MKQDFHKSTTQEREYAFLCIVGSGRCGTTAFAQILGSCRGFASTPELKYFVSAMANKKKFEPYHTEKAIERFFIHALKKVLKYNPDLQGQKESIITRFRDTLETRALVGLPLLEVYREIFYVLIQEFANDPTATYIVLQTPANIFYTDLIRAVLGPVKYIYMYRDPRNFFASAMKGNRRFHRKDVTMIAHWVLSMKYGEALQKASPGQCLFVSQEDLLLKQQDVLSRVANFLSQERLEVEEQTTIQNQNSSFGDAPLSAANMERYAKVMKQKEIYAVEYLTSHYLQKYYPHKPFSAYAPCTENDSDPPPLVGGVRGGGNEKFRLMSSYLLEMLKLRILLFFRAKGWINFYFTLKRIID